MKRIFEKYFKLPFKADKFGIYAWDANDKMVLQFDYEIFDEEEMEMLVTQINGETPENGNITFGELTYKNSDFFSNGEYIFCIRGWGYLTGEGGMNLTETEACEIQDDLANYILNKLK